MAEIAAQRSAALPQTKPQDVKLPLSEPLAVRIALIVAALMLYLSPMPTHPLRF